MSCFTMLFNRPEILKNAPSRRAVCIPIHGSLDPLDWASQTASLSVHPFCVAHGRESLSVTMCSHIPLQNCPFAWGIQTPSNTRFLPWANPRQRSEQHHNRFIHFCGAHGRVRPTDRQTDRAPYFVCRNRQHLASAAMRSNNNSKCQM